MADKNTYKVFIQFKNGKSLDFLIETDANIRGALLSEIESKYITIGDFTIDAREILWSRIEGDNAEHSE